MDASMNQRRIAVLGQKGGVGKSTTSIHLAAAAHLAGFRTLLLDLDKQGSTTWWNRQRPESGSPLEGLAVAKLSEDVGVARYRELGAPYDVVILDGPPALDDVTRSAAKFADTVVMPVQPGALDLVATESTIKILNEVDRDRREDDRPALRRTFILSRAIVGTSVARQAPALIEGGGEILGVFHQRLSFSDSISNGETVLTTKTDPKAAWEVRVVAKALGLVAGAKVVRA
jgi:chromosome partitioning protein